MYMVPDLINGADVSIHGWHYCGRDGRTIHILEPCLEVVDRAVESLDAVVIFEVLDEVAT
jgi:hypothetical protein